MAVHDPEGLTIASASLSSYRRVLESFQSLLGGLPDEDRARVFGENAADFYRLQQAVDARQKPEGGLKAKPVARTNV